MGIFDTLLESAGSEHIQQMGRQFGLDESDVRKVLGEIVPALGGKLDQNARRPEGLVALKDALRRGSHQEYLRQPERVTSRDGIEEGNAILGHILGSKDVSRRVAARASDSTGVSDSVIKGMLPMAATLLMGTLSKRSDSGEVADDRAEGGLGALLGSALDADGDGSALDDVMAMAKKFF